MKCPVCGNMECQEDAEEVDLGVGVQKRVLGWDCPECGYMDEAEFRRSESDNHL